MYDVIVIGGGPSGLHCAYKLSAAGLDVLVLEARSEIGKYVVCTGIVGTEAFEKFNLCRASILREIREMDIVSPRGSVIHYEHPDVLAYVVDRQMFDGYMAELATSNGAQINPRNEVFGIDIKERAVEVSANERNGSPAKYTCKMIVLATGISFKLSKMLGLGLPRDFLYGVNAHAILQGIENTTVYTGNDMAPGAFSWIVPLERGLSRIGLMTKENPAIYFQRFLERICTDEGRALEVKSLGYRPIAQGLVSKTYADRALSVGEAAGQVKTTTGGGIYYGLIGSEMASEVIVKAFRKDSFDEHNLSEYQRLWQQTIGNELTVGYNLRNLYSRLSDRQIEALFNVVKSDGVMPFIRREFRFDWHSELLHYLMRNSLIRRVFGIDKPPTQDQG